MKKVLCTIALMLLVAGSAYAQVTFSLTGDYWAEGKYWFNYNAGPDQKANYTDTSFGFYEQDINLYPKITVGNTSLNLALAITDVTWGDGGKPALSEPAEADDNILIERAFITHKFNDMFTLDVGLMDGTQWGTTFADEKQGRWRVKLTARTPVGVVGGLFEKVADIGYETGDAAGENRDTDHYGLFAITKVGDVFVKPLFFYVDQRASNKSLAEGTTLLNANLPGRFNNDDFAVLGSVLATGDRSLLAGLSNAGSALLFANDTTMLNLVLAFDGDLGPVSFESEFNYKKYDSEIYNPLLIGALGDDEFDWSVWGVYLNFWKELDAMTPGFLFAYGSWDDKGGVGETGYGFCYEDDFDATLILDDEYAWGNTSGGDGMVGMTTLKLYVNDIKTGIDPLTLSGYAAYVISNQEDNAYEDATAWEVALGAAYKITDNLTYSVYGAYADIDYDVTGIDDPDSVYLIANAIEFRF